MSDARPIYLVFGRTVDEYDDLTEAKRAAWYRSDGDEDWFDRLEIIEPNGNVTRLGYKDIPEFDQWDDEASERYRAARATKPHVANITVDHEILASFYGEEGLANARAEYERLLPYLGERVELKPVAAIRH